MAITIRSPRNSFVQFGESSLVTSCNFRDIDLCLPVLEDNDVYFQWYVTADTIEEADALCDLLNDLVTVGVVLTCDDEDFTIEFSEKPERFRIGSRTILYNWAHGLPGVTTDLAVGQCFSIRVVVDETEACSNCFQRIGDACHTTELEFGNDENFADFNYCNGGAIEEEIGDCRSTIVEFTNLTNITIPYTASLQAKYGDAPTIQTFIYDGPELVRTVVREAFDANPPTEIRIDFGGPASGIIIIR